MRAFDRRWGGLGRSSWLAAAVVLTQGTSMMSARPALRMQDAHFEVASVKPNANPERQFPPTHTGPDRVVLIKHTLRQLIMTAYDIPPQQIDRLLVGGSKELLSSTYDVNAKLPDGVSLRTSDGNHPWFSMLKTLLAERFSLRTHVEVRPLPVYALTVARPGKLGPGLRPSAVNCQTLKAAAFDRGTPLPTLESPRSQTGWKLCWNRDPPRRPGTWEEVYAGDTLDLVSSVQSFVGDRMVIDRTGLTGNYEWELIMSRDESIFSVVTDQLGLKLQPATAPINVIVIDRLQPLTPD